MKKLVLLVISFVLVINFSNASDCYPYEAGESCGTAPLCCFYGIDGYYGVLPFIPNPYPMNFITCGGTIDNPNYLSFVAGSTVLEITIIPEYCEYGQTGLIGMQAGLYEECEDTGDPNYSWVQSPVVENCMENNGPFALFANNMIIGETYILLLDGFGGSVCEYYIQVTNGTTAAPYIDDIEPQIDGPDYILNNEVYAFSTDLEFGVPTFNWTVTGGEIVTSYGSHNQYASILITDESNFQICVQGANDCYQTITSCETLGVDPDLVTIEETLCIGECYELDGQLFCETGTYYLSINEPTGLIPYRLILNIISYETILTETICFDNCYEYNGENYCSTGGYNFILTSSEGCDSSVVLELIVLEEDEPMVSVSNENDLDCENLTTTLNGSSSISNINYTWSGPGINNNNENDQNPEVDLPGIYTLIVSTNAGCSSSASIEVIAIDESPDITIEGNDPLNCNNDENTIVGSSSVPGLNYEWTGPGGFQETGNEISVSELGTYTLTGSKADWCSNSITFDVEMDMSPFFVDAGPNRHIQCEFVLTLDAPGANGNDVLYEWSTQNGNILNGENTLNPVINAAGVYTLTAIDLDNGCIATAEMIVHSELAIIEDENLSVDCIVSSVQLDATDSYQGGDATFEWSTADGSFIDGENTLTPTVGAGVYQLVISRPGCLSFATITVADNANPPSIDIDASSTVITCLSDVTLTAITDATNASFTWFRGIFMTSTEASLSTNIGGSYTLVIETPNGCSSTMIIEIEEEFDPESIVVFIEEVPNCSQDGVGALSAEVFGDEPSYEVIWFAYDGGEITSNQFEEYVTIQGSGLYCAESINPNTGCFVIDCVTVTATSDLDINENITEPSCPSASNGSIEIIVTGTPPFTYVWDGPGGIQTTQNIDNLEADTYTVTVTDDAGCEVTRTFVLESGNNDVVVANAGGDQRFDCSINSLELNGTTSEYPTGSIFMWETNDGTIDDGAETLMPTISSTGTYRLLIISPDGCEDIDIIIVADFEADAGPSQTLDCNHSTIQLEASAGPAGSSYEWLSNNGNIVNGENTISPTVDEAGIYTLLVTTENGCTYTDETTVDNDFEMPDVQVMDEVVFLEICDEVVNLLGLSDTPDVTYFWSGPGGTSNDELFPVVSPGVYELIVTAPNGCTSSAVSELIDNTFPPIITPSSAIQYLNCFNGNPLELDLFIETESNDTDILWSSLDGNIIEEIGNTILVDEAGTYQVSVFDNGNNCFTEEIIIVEERDAEISISSTIANCGVADASATVMTQYIHDPEFLWSTGENSATIDGLAPGVYALTVSSPESTCDEILMVEIIQDPSCFVLISGYIYDDENLNCDPNNNAEPKAGVLVTISPEDLETTTDIEGYYEFLVPPGDYTVTPQLVSPFVVECPSESIDVSVPAGSQGSDNNNFFVKALSGFDLYVTAGSSPANAGSNQNYQISYCNNGFTTIFGTVEFTHDPLVVFDPVASGASSYNSDTYTAVWDFEDFSFFECDFIGFQIFVPADIPDGTEISSSVIILPTQGDIAPNNNSVSWIKVANNTSLTNPGDDYNEIQSNQEPILGESISKVRQYPNPFSKETYIDFVLQIEEDVEIQVFDVSGRKIKSYTGFENGFNRLIIKGNELPIEGIYFYKIIGSTVFKTGRMIKH